MSRENLFSINLESDSIIDHGEFIIKKESEELAAKRAELNKRLNSDIIKSVKKSVFASLLPLIPTLLGMVLCSIAFSDDGKVSVVPAFLAGVLLFCGFAWHIRNKKKEKAEEDKSSDKILDALDKEYGDLNELVKSELGVPSDAKEIEIFADMYSDDNDKDSDRIYTNDTALVYKDGDKLCFLYGSSVIGISISSIESLVKSCEQIGFEMWEKDIPYDRGSYMQYKIKKIAIDKYDEFYSMEGYYSLRFAHLDTQFEVIIPLYDIEPVLDILKIEPIEE